MSDEGAAPDEGSRAASPPRHRRPGDASTNKPNKPPVTFGQVLRDDPREILAVALGTLLALVLGTVAVVNGPGLGDRALGVAVVAAGMFLVLSYGFRFRHTLLDTPAWTRTPLRRATRWALLHAWAVLFNVAFVVFLAIAARRRWE